MRPSTCALALLPLLLGSLLASCVAPPEPAGGDPGEAGPAAGLDALYERFSAAYANLDLDALVGLYAEEALYLPPSGGILEGRGAVRESFSGFFRWAAENDVVVELAFDIVDRTIREDMAVDVGYYSLTTTPPAESGESAGHSVGKFITVAERDDAGAWHFRIDGYSPAPPEVLDTGPSPVAAQARGESAAP